MWSLSFFSDSTSFISFGATISLILISFPSKLAYFINSTISGTLFPTPVTFVLRSVFLTKPLVSGTLFLISVVFVF